MKSYEMTIGLEIHVELNTKTKIFCSCENKFGGEANTRCCPICIGMPGTLPVLNKKVIEYGIMAGLVTNCTISKYINFDRKNYFYPDLPKSYQTSQLYLPICTNGYLDINLNENKKRIGICEIHMEEDAGKLIHDLDNNCTLIDYNRCGIPLLEIVTNPDMSSPDEVILFLEKLKSILQYAGISDCKMQEGSMRADINLSVRESNTSKLGTRTEMKNMSSFKAIYTAINQESKRQIQILESGKKVIQETRRWDELKNTSFSMRSKEDIQDYRYFPEPDLLPITIDDLWIDRIKTSLPEMPNEKRERYLNEYLLSEYETNIIVNSKYLANIFEQTTNICKNSKETANIIIGDVMRMLKETAKAPEEITFSSENLAKLIILIQNKTINRTIAKDIFDLIFLNNIDPELYVKQHNLEMLQDNELIKNIVCNVLNSNIQAIKDFRNGKTQVVKFLVGKTMKELKGRANPALVNDILKEQLDNFKI